MRCYGLKGKYLYLVVEFFCKSEELAGIPVCESGHGAQLPPHWQGRGNKNTDSTPRGLHETRPFGAVLLWPENVTDRAGNVWSDAI